MRPSVDADRDFEEVDFKPFFDMIVGVLFFLIILISSQIFFAQQSSDTTEQAARRELLIRDRQITAFLEKVVDRLKELGLEAKANTTSRSIYFQRDQFSAASSGNEVRFADGAITKLGQVLSEQLGCVLAPVDRRQACPDTDRMRLDEVQAVWRINGPSPDPSLSSERYAQFISTLFSAAILVKDPSLLGLTGNSGTPALRFLSMSAPASASEARSSVDSLSLNFVFAD